MTVWSQMIRWERQRGRARVRSRLRSRTTLTMSIAPWQRFPLWFGNVIDIKLTSLQNLHSD